MVQLRRRATVVGLILLAATFAFCVAAQADVEKQLCFLIDGSGSIPSEDFYDCILRGLSDAVESTLPVDGTIEICVVQFAGNIGAAVEIEPTILDDMSTANYLAEAIRGIQQAEGGTPLAVGIDVAMDAMLWSQWGEYATQFINISTDGDPDDKEAARASVEYAVENGLDHLSAEAIGISPGSDSYAFLEQLVQIARTGFVHAVADASGYPEAIARKAAGREGTIVGWVVDSTTGDPVEGAIASTSGGSIAQTNRDGVFAVESMPSPHVVVSVVAERYTSAWVTVPVSSDEETNLPEILLKPIGITETVWAEDGGEVSYAGASVIIPPNALVDAFGDPVYGEVEVSLTAFDPTAPLQFDPSRTEADLFAGGTFVPCSLEGSMLVSYGFIDIVAEAGGERVDLAPGAEAEIGIPVAVGLADEADWEIPLWYFDEQLGCWVEQTDRTLYLEDSYDAPSGLRWAGAIPHFSQWNADSLFDTACVSGRVVDENGNPVGKALVALRGIKPSKAPDGYRTSTFTENDGSFFIDGKMGSSAIISVSVGGVKSVVEIPIQLPNQHGFSGVPSTCVAIAELNPITIRQTVRATLSWTSSADLDIHLTGPSETGGTFHVYYNNLGSETSPPYATLDTDTRPGPGAEVITLFGKTPGTYCITVHNYSSESAFSFCDSGAYVQFTAPGSNLRVDIPKQNVNKTDIWHVLSFEIRSDGTVAQPVRINRLQGSGTHMSGDIDSFDCR